MVYQLKLYRSHSDFNANQEEMSADGWTIKSSAILPAGGPSGPYYAVHVMWERSR